MEGRKRKRFGYRNLTQVSDFPYVYTKIRCGASRLLELINQEIGDRSLLHFPPLLSVIWLSRRQMV